VPIHTFGGQGNLPAISTSRSGRFVSTWNVCCAHSCITSKTRRMNDKGTSSWKRSLIELTKMIRPSRHRRGVSSAASSSTTLPVKYGRPLRVLRAVPRYLLCPMASSRVAIRAA